MSGKAIVLKAPVTYPGQLAIPVGNHFTLEAVRGIQRLANL